MQRREWLGASLAGAAALGLQACAGWQPARELAPLDPAADSPDAPATPREWRAAWVATVANIDWPSRPGLSDAQQIAEMLALLDRARDTGLNAIVLQVRTSADAFYPSTLEPWSEYLSGRQGQAPGYDPLARWIAEAHARGLELHAWFNPYRARQSAARSEAAEQHLSRSKPDWVKRYGDQLWIDPGEPAAAEHTLAVFREVLSRYPVDGIHIDDYFYPYPVNDPATKQEIDFPDEPSWQAYRAGGGTLARADWRRANVDGLVQRLHALVRELRPEARLGISPFGLPRPDKRPPGIAGFSQYDKLYANVEYWLAQGWLDYLVPQLYWPRAQTAQAFEPLMDAWAGLNPQGRHVWPGLFTSKVTLDDKSWPVEEILAQVQLTRRLQPSAGHAHFSMVALAQNRRGLADALRQGPYARPALPPETPWLEAPACGAPRLRRLADGRLQALSGPGAPARRFALWTLHQDEADWRLQLLGPDGLAPAPTDARLALVSAQNGCGREGPRARFRLSA